MNVGQPQPVSVRNKPDPSLQQKTRRKDYNTMSLKYSDTSLTTQISGDDTNPTNSNDHTMIHSIFSMRRWY